MSYDERVLGSSEFVTEILADADWERRQALRTAKITLAELAERVLAKTGLKGQELRSSVKRPEAVAARRAFTQLAVREYGYSAAAVARYLGVVASTSSRQASEGELTPLARRIRNRLLGRNA